VRKIDMLDAGATFPSQPLHTYSSVALVQISLLQMPQ